MIREEHEVWPVARARGAQARLAAGVGTPHRDPHGLHALSRAVELLVGRGRLWGRRLSVTLRLHDAPLAACGRAGTTRHVGLQAASKRGAQRCNTGWRRSQPMRYSGRSSCSSPALLITATASCSGLFPSRITLLNDDYFKREALAFAGVERRRIGRGVRSADSVNKDRQLHAGRRSSRCGLARRAFRGGTGWLRGASAAAAAAIHPRAPPLRRPRARLNMARRPPPLQTLRTLWLSWGGRAERLGAARSGGVGCRLTQGHRMWRRRPAVKPESSPHTASGEC